MSKSTKVLLKQGIALTGKSDSTLRRDMKSGKVSYEKDDRGKVHFDTAELARAYGELQPLDTPTTYPVNNL